MVESSCFLSLYPDPVLVPRSQQALDCQVSFGTHLYERGVSLNSKNRNYFET